MSCMLLENLEKLVEVYNNCSLSDDIKNYDYHINLLEMEIKSIEKNRFCSGYLFTTQEIREFNKPNIDKDLFYKSVAVRLKAEVEDIRRIKEEAIEEFNESLYEELCSLTK